MADNEIDVKFGAQIGDLKAGLNEASSAVESTSEKMKGNLGGATEAMAEKVKDLQSGLNGAASGITGALSEITEAFSGFFAGLVIFEVGKEIVETFERIGEAIAGVAEQGDELLKAGQKTGIAVEQLSQLKYAANLADVDFGSLETGLTRLSVNMEKAAAGGGDAAGAFKALGLSVTDGEGHLKPLNQMIEELADKFSGLADGPAKAALAVAIFGRAGADLIPFLDAGGDAIKRMENEATAFGVTFSGPAAEAAEKFNDNLKRVEEAGSGLWQTFVQHLIPAFSDLFDQIANIIGNSPLLKQAIDGIGAGFGVAVLAVDALVMGLRLATDLVSIFYHSLADPMQALGTLVSDVITGNVGRLSSDFAAAADEMKKHFTDDVGDMAAAWESFQNTAKKVFGITGVEGDQSPKPQAPVFGGDTGSGKNQQATYDDGMQMLKEELQAEVEALRQSDLEKINLAKSTANQQLAIRQQNLGTLQQLGQLNADDEERHAVALANEKYQIEVRAIDQEMQLALTTEQRKAQLQQQELTAYQKLQLDLNRIHNQAVLQRQQAEQRAEQQSRATWQSLISPVTGAFNQITAGILQGTQTWQNVIANAGQTVFTTLISLGERWLEQYLLDLVVGETAHKTSAASQISADAATAAAGAYSSVAAIPYVGWVMAPGVAAQAFGTVMAFQSGVAFDVGTGSVPADMSANVHRGEIIVPATMSDAIRSGQLTLGGPGGGGAGGGGGNSVAMGDIHLHSVSPDYDARQLLKALAKGLRDNPGLKVALT